METNKNRRYYDNEYFEEDIKIEDDLKEKQILRHVCKICQRVYKSNANVSTHIQSVHKQNKYPCDQCEYQATGKGHLKTHILSVHEKVKYPCDQCGE